MKKTALLASVSFLTVCTVLSGRTVYAEDNHANGLLGLLPQSSSGQEQTQGAGGWSRGSNTTRSGSTSGAVIGVLGSLNQIVTQFSQSIAGYQTNIVPSPGSSGNDSKLLGGGSSSDEKRSDIGSTLGSAGGLLTNTNTNTNTSHVSHSGSSSAPSAGQVTSGSNGQIDTRTVHRHESSSSTHPSGKSGLAAHGSSAKTATSAGGALKAVLAQYHQSTVDDATAHGALLSSVNAYEQALRDASSSSNTNLFIKHQQDAANALEDLRNALEKQGENNQTLNHLQQAVNAKDVNQMEALLGQMATLERQKVAFLQDAATTLNSAATDIESNL